MLKIAIFGTGGVGGIFGALFAKAGHTVHFIARGEHLKAIQTQGLSIRRSLGNFEIQPALVSGSALEASQSIGVFDLVLVCVKAWQLLEAREQIKPLIGNQTLILPLLNGVEAAEFLAASYPHEQILRGFCAVISYVQAPGVIEQMGIPPYLAFGELEAPHVSARVLKLKQELSVPGLVLDTPENLKTQQWQKFIFISSLAAITSVSRLPVGPLRVIPETRKVIEDAMKEVVAIGLALGVALPKDAVAKAMKRVDEMPDDGTTSMQRDFAAHRGTELEMFSGYVIRAGERLGIPTPIHRTCYALLLPRMP